jgi:type VI secretion system protein ImpI
VAITLRIDNFDQLPDGGPVEYRAGARGFDIGREQQLDWCLPDPDRVVSGHHCQVRYEGGSYLLYDISRNGTYVNGSPGRVKSPYQLQHGDRLQIGPYIVAVAIGAGNEAPPPYAPEHYAPQPAGDPYHSGGWDDPWGGNTGGGAAPVDRRLFVDQQRRERGVRAPDAIEDFIPFPVARAPEPFQPPPSLRNVPPSQIPDRAPAYAPNRPTPGGMPPAPAGYGAPQGGGLPLETFLQILAQSAGLSPQALMGRPPDQIADEIGAIIRTVATDLAVLLKARAAAKQMAKSGNRTMLGAERNNPLKFIPNPTEALELMFQQNRPGYLNAPESFREGLDNIKAHERATYAAMQKALLRIMEDFHPDRIEDKAGGGAFGSKKAKAWDIYLERWTAKTEHYENGMLDVFLAYFADAYDTALKDG